MGLLEKLGLRKAPARPDASAARVAELQTRLRLVRARYDAAQTTVDNSKHWSGADGLSALAANSREVRRTLRNRSRYEVANNGYADGIAQTLANDTVGTGPRLQVRTGSPEDDARLEAAWAEWAQAVDLPSKLWAMRFAKFEDGEAFALLRTNQALRSAVKLDLQLVEADQVSTPTFNAESPDAVDGIVFDRAGNPVEYHILKSHPGDPLYAGASYDYDRIAAKNVLHYFRVRRPGQKRGVPEITSAVTLFAQLRRYTLAVIAAAEVAADFALVIQSKNPPTSEDAPAPEMLDTIELEKRMATVLPEGYELGQAKPEQPTTTYADFKRQILSEIARPLNMPFNVAAGDSSSYNYASGRLDHQTYFKALDVERALLRRAILEPLFRAWLDEAVLVTDLLPQRFRTLQVPMRREWLWNGREHVDPSKEASAQETRLRNLTSTLADECGQTGKDWEAQLRQVARERALMKELGIAMPASPGLVPVPETEDDEDA